MKTKRFITTLVALLAMTGAWAYNGQISGGGTSEDPFLIQDRADWNKFTNNINEGINADSYYLLDDDIDSYNDPVTTIIGNASTNPFSGTLDGNGHNLRVKIRSTEQYAAPFQYLNGATIKNLHVKGTVTGGQYCGGMAGNMSDSNIENCRVSTEVSSTNTGYYIGGIVGFGNGTNHVTGCLFDGSGSYCYRMGTLMGYAHATTTQYIVNCVERGSYSSGLQYAVAWSNGSSNRYTVMDNIYQISPQVVVPSCMNVSYDRLLAHTITGGASITSPYPNGSSTYTSITLTNTGTTTSYDISGLTFYKNGSSPAGFMYGGELYAANTQQVELQYPLISNQNDIWLTGLTTSAGTLEGGNPATLTMPNSDVYITVNYEENYIQGSGTEDDPYLIRSIYDIKQLAHFVNGGKSYSGCYFKQTENVGSAEMIGTEVTPFAGIYDGNGRNLYVNISSTERYVAPFHYATGATIKNLFVDGKVTGEVLAAGLIGMANNCKVENCRINTDIESSKETGGIIGEAKEGTGVTVTGCIFDGSVTNSSRVGVFIGWTTNANSHRIVNSVEKGTYDNCKNVFSAFKYTSSGGGTYQVDNCYLLNPTVMSAYTNSPTAYSITPGAYVTINNTATPTVYDVSDITIYKDGNYATGCKVNDVLYASSGQRVGLNVTKDIPDDVILLGSDYSATAGKLTSSAPFTNPYTLTMPASNVAVCVRMEYQEPQGAAIWCNENTTLYFDCTKKIWEMGDTYNGHAVTKAWNREQVINSQLNLWLHPELCNSLTNVVFQSNFLNVKPISLNDMFYRCKKLEVITGLNYLDTSNVTDMGDMFCECSSLTNLDLSNFNTANVTSMIWMFEGCSSLTNLDLSNFNTAKVKYMNYMFYNCKKLTSLDVSNFNTANVRDMERMFWDCSSLTSLDVSHFNTANVTDMSYMFSGCYSLTSLDVSNFNTANVTNMSLMFEDCYSLTSLDVSNFNTANVTDMYRMFDSCSHLTSLDVSKFNTANVTNMGAMFASCSRLKTIYAQSDWNGQSVGNSEGMFNGCTSLTGAIPFASDKTDVSYANPTTGYFTVKGDANRDKKVTITDAVAVVNSILGNSSSDFNPAAANVNGDFDEDGEPQITITDAVGIVNIILNSGE